MIIVTTLGSGPFRARVVTGPPPPGPTPAGGSGLSVRLVVTGRSFPQGARILVTVQVDNQTGHQVSIGDCAVDGWPYVGLEDGHGRSYMGANPAIGCQPLALAPGITTYSRVALGSYPACTQSPVQVTRPNVPVLPRCDAAGTAPLPAGHYSLHVFAAGFPAGTHLPAAIPVTLFPRPAGGGG